MNTFLKRAGRHADLAAAGAVVLVVVMMIVPLPPFLLDLAITLNISAALMIVVATLYVPRALDFSAFPSLLLLTTLFRLAINVSVTRLVLLPELCRQVLGVAQRAAFAYLVIAIADVAYQRWRHEKNLKMDKQEVKDEHKQQELPSEVKSMQRQRAMQMARARMMDGVPTADVVVTNPTHYSVALRYSADAPAPVVVAKGQDLVALRIRELAAEHGVMVVPDPPLARAIHGTVDVGRMIPEELFQAVAELLAYVYRVAGRSVA